MRKTLWVLAICLFATIGLQLPFAGHVQAEVVVVMIDDFQAGDYLLGREGTTPPNTVSGTQYDGTGTHIIGGQRDVTLQKFSGSGISPYVNCSSTVTYLGYTGFSSYNSNFNCNALWTTTYGLGADLNADLTDNGTADRISIVIDGDQDDSVPTRPIPLTITVVSGTGTASVTKNMVADGVHVFGFTEFAGVDFSDVDRLVFEIEQDSQYNDAIDFAIFQIYAGAETVPVETTTWGTLKSLYRSQ